MRCTSVEKFLPLYVAGDLAGQRAERRVTNHLATCERCRGLATGYEASRNLVRDAATLPPDFDGAFYEELRSSVLAEIRRGGTRLAPPAPRAVFAAFFNARFAYAASLAFLIATLAALSLQSYKGRKFADDTRQNTLADANRERTVTPQATATPLPTGATSGERQTLSPINDRTREDENKGSQLANLPSSPKRRAKEDNVRNEAQRSVNLAEHTPSRAQQNPLAPIIAPPPQNTAVNATANAQEIARGGGDGGGATDAPEVSRIEMQTSDPNIRIIWLSPRPDAVVQPLK